MHRWKKGEVSWTQNRSFGSWKGNEIVWTELLQLSMAAEWHPGLLLGQQATAEGGLAGSQPQPGEKSVKQ